MRLIQSFLIFTLLISFGCDSEKKESLYLDYLIWPSDEIDNFRVYESLGTDSSTAIILATQKMEYLKDSVISLEYLLLPQALKRELAELSDQVT